jgi:hypothetical protein
MLMVCLENLIQKVRGIRDNKEVWIAEDVHADKPKSFTTQMEMLACIRFAQNEFGRDFSYLATQPHTTYGNSYNVLSALQKAAQYAEGKVYLIEDDVLVTPDFFEWNDMVFNQYDAKVVCAGRLNRSLNFRFNGPDAMDESIRDVNAVKKVVGAYNSWATCFSLSFMEMFKDSIDQFKMRPGFEQDTMIQDRMRICKIASIWPYVPRAYHMGWYSYHRTGGFRPQGTLEQRVKDFQKVMSNSTKLRTLGAGEMDPFPVEHHEAATRLYLPSAP